MIYGIRSVQKEVINPIYGPLPLVFVLSGREGVGRTFSGGEILSFGAVPLIFKVQS